ncbi:MAG: creatininase family protein, partial [Alphaproteobacteria bacterium]
MEQRPRRLWADMTAAEIAALDTSRLIAVLPVAAIEQHGPHLPLAVDAIIAQGILDHALALIPDELPVTVLPLQAVGYSVEHGAFPGTLSLSAETLAASWRELGRSLADAGV